MEDKKKQGIYLILAGAAVLVGVLVFVFGMPDTVPGDTPTATTTEPVATTTDTFDMEPIVPEAKVSTEGWKTCRNEEYGYEFKFPAEWHIYGEDALSEPDLLGKRAYVRESEECSGLHVVVASYDVTLSYGSEPSAPSVSVHVRDIVAEREKWNKNYSLTLEELYDAPSKNKPAYALYTLEGEKALFHIDRFPQAQIPNEEWNFDTYIDRWRYRITLGGESVDSVRDNHETILSTFRFFDTSRAIGTSESE